MNVHSPRYRLSVVPVDAKTVRVTCVKTWWGGPRIGGQQRSIYNTTVETSSTWSEGRRVAAALDAVSGWLCSQYGKRVAREVGQQLELPLRVGPAERRP